jgi:hypothetical protein
MPRIAAAIGVFAAIALCIFINIKRYPSVWDMVGASPWFTQATNDSSQDPSPQPTEMTETVAPEKSLPAPQPVPEKQIPRTLPSLKPQLGNQSSPTTDLQVDSSASKSAAGSLDATPNRTQTAKTQTSAYQGLNPGPIRVPGPAPSSVATGNNKPEKPQNGLPPKRHGAEQQPRQTVENEGATIPPDPGGENWPAEMSPRMKYAAKPPLLESYQQWNPERPVVPVVRPKEDEKKDDAKPAESKDEKSKDDAKPDGKDSSSIAPAKRSVAMAPSVLAPSVLAPSVLGPSVLGPSDDDEVVRHLPPVNPSQRPIRMSIQGGYPDKPIPVYPSTGR